MRADDCTLTAVDAQARIPDWDLSCQSALFPLGSCGREGAIDRQCTYWQQVALAREHACRHVADEIRRVLGHWRHAVDRAVGCSRDLDFVHLLERTVDRSEVALDDDAATAGVRLLDVLLDEADRLIARQHARQHEEARLHDGVDARTEADLASDAAGVDDVDLQRLVDDLLLHFARQALPHCIGRVRAVDEHGRTVRGSVEHRHPLKQVELVTGDEVGIVDEVRRLDRVRPEAQMRDGHRAGLLGVVDEVALRPHVGVLADDLDARLVRANGAVAAQAVEHALPRRGCRRKSLNWWQ